MSVDSDIPNVSSIGSSLSNYKVFEGVRIVPMSDFSITGKSYSASENRRIMSLQEDIKKNKTIKPLIVVLDTGGSYILEGGHRIDALYNLGCDAFPALVVEDLSNENI